VRRGQAPGTFFFSVLDNGVTSTEFWRIVAVADDLSWILFYYSGGVMCLRTHIHTWEEEGVGLVSRA
jgi:hypothetical protein